MEIPNILLSGITGSRAYGLATQDSDTDRLGTFAQPTTVLLGLTAYERSHISTKPDVTYHEAGKLALLLLACNPTVTELLWLPDDLHEVRTALGSDLIAIRQCFLSAPLVKSAYLGYATQQFERLQRRCGLMNVDISGTRQRTAKHARHLLRLLIQGTELYRTGMLTVALQDPERCREFGDRVAAGDLDTARTEIADAGRLFGASATPLPEYPDTRTAQDWLLSVRAAFW
jgi:hypothetical protein